MQAVLLQLGKHIRVDHLLSVRRHAFNERTGGRRVKAL